MEKQLLFVNLWIWKKRSSSISTMAEEEYGKNETVKIIKSITSENTTKLRKKIEREHFTFEKFRQSLDIFCKSGYT